jgi:hypothetical protein
MINRPVAMNLNKRAALIMTGITLPIHFIHMSKS